MISTFLQENVKSFYSRERKVTQSVNQSGGERFTVKSGG